jgi:drug/metabolite transporter (DMT)-like permease
VRRVLLLACIWGWSFLFIKVAVGGMTPTAVAGSRIGLGAVTMLVALRVRGTTLPRDAASWRHFTVMGAVHSAIPFALLAWGEQRITSALAAVLNASTALFAALFVAVALGERLRPNQLAGLVLGFIGVGVAAGVGGHDLASSSVSGGMACVGAGAFYGAGFAYAQRHLTSVPPIEAAAGQLIAAAAVIGPLAVGTSVASGIHLDAHRVLAVGLLGVVGTALAYIINYQSIAAVGSTRTSLVTYLVPVVAVAVGVVFLGERFHLRLLAGGTLIIGGIAMLQGRLRRVRRVPVALP